MIYTDKKFKNLVDSIISDTFGQTTWSTYSTNPTPEYYSEKFDDHYLLELPVPGLTKTDITVKIIEDKLEIKGGNQDCRWARNIEHSFKVPRDVNHKNISGVVENGVLTVKLGLSEKFESIVKIV
jgi:HSP20 family molecular chaperone IbpA